MPTPYQETAAIYWSAGWRGVLPLPEHAKSPVPRGFTGWAGADPSFADVTDWIEAGVRVGGSRRPAGNIGLRIPRGFYGLDVDDYAGKTGGAALSRLVEAYGPLPATWTVTSRDDGTSGIRLFRADHGDGRRWKDEPAGHGAGIEAIHFGHRYAVTWPSVHPDTGRKYQLYRPDGIVAPDGIVPRLDELPEMPPRWRYELSEPGEIRVGEVAGHAETLAAVGSWPTGEPCRRIADARGRAMHALTTAASGASLHPSALASTHELCNLGNEGHRGARAALAEHHDVFVEVRVGRGAIDMNEAAREWWRMVQGGVGKLIAENHRTSCDCDAWSSAGLDFTPDDWPATPDEPLDLFLDPAPVGQLVDAELENFPPDQSTMSPIERLRAELFTPSGIKARPRPRPVVQGLLYANTLAWLIGKSGSFKSFVALDVAAAVAEPIEGNRWAARRVWGGPVLYVAAEGGGGMGLRVEAWERHNGRPMPEHLTMLTRPVQVASQGWPVLVELAAELRPVLIVIDTQARVTVGIKENDNTEIGQMIEKLDQLRKATGACVWTVHHIGRSGEDARGASSLDGAQDTELKVERVGGPRSLRGRLVIDKQKDAPDTDAIEFEMRSIDLGVDPYTNEPTTSLAVEASGVLMDPFEAAPWRADLQRNQVVILDILRELFSETGGTRADVRTALRERGVRDTKWINNSFGHAWNSLLEKDLIERVGTTQRFVVVNDNATVAINGG
jgi:hypothetical protein